MIRLNTNGFSWLDLGDGQKVQCKTPNYIDLKAAEKHKDVRDAGVGKDGKPSADAAIYMAQHLVMDTLIGWAGICDEDGNPVEFSEEGREAFSKNMDAATQYLTAYVDRINVADAEKNASAPLLNGSTAGETTIAAAAEAPAKTAPA